MALGLSSYWSIRTAWADHLSRSTSLSDRVHATRLAPGWATLYERLADRRIDLGQNALPDLYLGTLLEPENPDRLERLAQAAEMAGDPLAEHSLLSAAARSNLFQPRYLLAQFYFRQGHQPAFRRWARDALDRAPGDVRPLLDLYWRASGEITQGRRQILRQWLAFLIEKRERKMAAKLARQLQATATTADRQALLEYVEAALEERDTSNALETWNTLCRRKLLPDAPLDPGGLTNDEFAHPPIGAGFDWRVATLPGIRATFGRGLRVSFSGTQPENCTLMWQYVPLPVGMRYRAISQGLPVGLSWTVEPGNASGNLARLALIYQRPTGSPRFEGNAVLNHLSLERVP
jgi:hypothetical protein